ncbi:MAG: hypothetical protein IBX69_05650 [Anaerolineales bacterium]|nr:hypothetical protein [Anaerolineales bacterium]
MRLPSEQPGSRDQYSKIGEFYGVGFQSDNLVDAKVNDDNIKFMIWITGLLAFLLSTQLFIRIVSGAVWPHIPKTLAGSITTYLALFGVSGALLSIIIFIVELKIIGFDLSFKRLLFSMPMAVILYLTAVLLSTTFVNRVTAPPQCF